MNKLFAGYCPSRVNVQYKYAIGICLRNAGRPMQVSEMYDFIKVNMPAICTWKNDNWENCLRSNLTMEWFKKIEVAVPNFKRAETYYAFGPNKEKEWEAEFPIDKYSSYEYLKNPQIHKALYNGEVGLPSGVEIREARKSFKQERAPWRQDKQRKRKKFLAEIMEGEVERKREERQRKAELARAVGAMDRSNHQEEEEYDNDFVPDEDYPQEQKFVPINPMPLQFLNNGYSPNQMPSPLAVNNQQHQLQKRQQHQPTVYKIKGLPGNFRMSPYNSPRQQTVRQGTSRQFHSPAQRIHGAANYHNFNYENVNPAPAYQTQFQQMQNYQTQNGFALPNTISPQRLLSQMQIASPLQARQRQVADMQDWECRAELQRQEELSRAINSFNGQVKQEYGNNYNVPLQIQHYEARESNEENLQYQQL